MISYTAERAANEIESRVRQDGDLTLNVAWGTGPELRTELARRGIRMSMDLECPLYGNWFRFALSEAA